VGALEASDTITHISLKLRAIVRISSASMKYATQIISCPQARSCCPLPPIKHRAYSPPSHSTPQATTPGTSRSGR
jgi:hypothetical protein